MIQATLCLYSGRKSPSKELSVHEGAEIKYLLSQLNDKAPSTFHFPLGQIQLIVDSNFIVSAMNGIVSIRSGDQKWVYWDTMGIEAMARYYLRGEIIADRQWGC